MGGVTSIGSDEASIADGMGVVEEDIPTPLPVDDVTAVAVETEDDICMDEEHDMTSCCMFICICCCCADVGIRMFP